MLITVYYVSLFVAFVCGKYDEKLERRQLPDPPHEARILSYQYDNTGFGPYQFGFSTSDGIERVEVGDVKDPNTEHASLVVSGSYTYPGPDGVIYTVKYTADENGFHPEGDHIKVPPYVTSEDSHDQSGLYRQTEEKAYPPKLYENGNDVPQIVSTTYKPRAFRAYNEETDSVNVALPRRIIDAHQEDAVKSILDNILGTNDKESDNRTFKIDDINSL